MRQDSNWERRKLYIAAINIEGVMQTDTIEVIVVNTGMRYEVVPGLSLGEILREIGYRGEREMLGAMVNNRLRDLGFKVYQPKQIEYIDITHPAGIRMYVNSLFFLMQYAVRRLDARYRLSIEHSVSNGYFCKIKGLDEETTVELSNRVAREMRELVDRDLPFTTRPTLTDDAIKLFELQGDGEKVRLLRSRPKLYTTLYRLSGVWDYFSEGLVPSTGYLRHFDVLKYFSGLLLRVPLQERPEELAPVVLQPKMYEIFREFKNWLDVLDLEDAGMINEAIRQGRGRQIVQICEALHEKKVAQIADTIKARGGSVRIVLVAGPSSSGKTTFSKRLAVQLFVSGLQPHTLELDNYFVDREKTPRDARGEYNFESIDALDIDQFNADLLSLLHGERVQMPKFDFTRGKRFYDGTALSLGARDVLIVEGIHALNPKLTPHIPEESRFKIYLSALTSISLDGLNRISSSDNRLLRRMVRDARFRGYTAVETIRRWQSVRRGEEENIFPYQEEADVMFNSALPYEFNVLKNSAEVLLNDVPSSISEHSEAVRLSRFLEFFAPLENPEIPPTSLLREFLGGSSFSYK